MASTQLVRWDTNVVSRGFKTRRTRHTTIVSQGIQTCILSGFCAGFTCIPRDSTLGSCLYPQGRHILFPQGYKPYPGRQFCVPRDTNCILTSKGYCFVSLGYNKGGADEVLRMARSHSANQAPSPAVVRLLAATAARATRAPPARARAVPVRSCARPVASLARATRRAPRARLASRAPRRAPAAPPR